jgi:AcrR family transcriptional regulator
MEPERREALLRAALDELAGAGYQDASLQRVLRRSGVERGEFEEEFADLDDCLIAAYGLLTDEVFERARGACEEGAEWPARVRAGLATVLRDLAADPRMSMVVFRAFPGARPSFYARYVEFLGRFEPLMGEGRDFSGIEEELPGEVELLSIGAAESIIYGELDAGRAEALPGLLPEILFSTLVPFLGPERAADEMRNAAAAS